MELKRRFDFRKVVTILYVLAFSVYLIIGLQPAEAANYEISGNLSIPSINLNSDVTSIDLIDHKLNTPDTIVGSYTKYDTKIFLIGHSTTVFKNLENVQIEDYIYYNGEIYKVVATDTFEKNNVNMNKLLAPETQKTLVIMTCSGEILPGKDATHRFVVTAVRVE